MKDRILALRHNQFLRNNAVYFSASLVISLINYIYYPILGRLMQPADFGEAQLVISFFAHVAILLSVLGIVTIGILNSYSDKGEREAVVNEVLRASLAVAALVVVVICLASPWLQRFFNFSSPWALVALALAFFVSVPMSFANSFLQAEQRFSALSRASLVGSLAKVGFGVAFVLVGWHAFGAVFGLALAQAIGFIYAIWLSHGHFGLIRQVSHLHKPKYALIKPQLRYAGLVFMTSLAINVLFTLDTLVVKHFFNPTTAGLYAGISIIGGIVYYLTGTLAIVLLSSIKPAQPDKNKALLKQSLALCTLIGGGAAIVFAMVPRLIITILIGHKYLPYAFLLPRLGLAVFALALANLFVYYYVAQRRYLIGPFALAGFAASLISVSLWHASITAIINSILYGALVILGLVGLNSLRLRGNHG